MQRKKEVEVNYSAFLLRLWREETSGEWRATLKDVRNGEQVNFGSVPPLLDYLVAQTSDGEPAANNDSA